ncbi:MAG: hypothetical protein HKN44_01490 [Ilumatobacter sp.]|nr:hypothetical protein [Ilumatobacter sp.]
MGLFSKRSAEPLVYPAVERVVHVPADRDAVVAHLNDYSELSSPKHGEQHEMSVGVAGGWTAIRLPDATDPWQLHNLAFWMLDCPGRDDAHEVIAVSAASPDHPGYRLVRDPEVSDALCGWDDDGQGWTVQVPGNRIVRGEDVPTPRALSVPSGHQEWQPVSVLLEDPGHGVNERNESNWKSRKSFDQVDVYMHF